MTYRIKRKLKLSRFNTVPINFNTLVDLQPEFNEPGENKRTVQQVKTKIKHYESDFDLGKLPSGAPRDILYNDSNIPSPNDSYAWYTNAPVSKVYMGGGTEGSDFVIITPDTANTRYRVRFGVAWSGHNRWGWDMKVPGGYTSGHAQLHWLKGLYAGACLAFNANLDGNGVWQANAVPDQDNQVRFSTYRVRGDGTYLWNQTGLLSVGADFADYRRFLLMGSIDAFSLFIDHKREAYFERHKPFSNDIVYAEFEAITNSNPAPTPITQYLDYCLMEAQDSVRVQSTREISLIYTINYLQQLAASKYGSVDVGTVGTKDVVSLEVPVGKMMLLLGFQASQVVAKANVWQVTNTTSNVTYGRWIYEGPNVVNVDFSTPQVVGVGRDIVKLQIIVSSPSTTTTAYGVLRYAFV